MKLLACLAFTVAVAACSSHSSQLTGGNGGGTGGNGGGAGTGGGDGGSGGGGGGSTGPANPPPDGKFPIEHIIVVVKENHTFDNYFGSFPGAEGTTTCKKSDGSTFPCPHAPNFTSHDLSHAHSAGLVDYNNGKMDGWDLPN
ncbi:MAG: alkaline phosphatase family protein, partial [Polyangia bacterium]